MESPKNDKIKSKLNVHKYKSKINQTAVNSIKEPSICPTTAAVLQRFLNFDDMKSEISDIPIRASNDGRRITHFNADVEYFNETHNKLKPVQEIFDPKK